MKETNEQKVKTILLICGVCAVMAFVIMCVIVKAIG